MIRSLFFVILAGLALPVWAQQSELPGVAPGKVRKALEVDIPASRLTPILVVDFADGIPDGWESDDVGGVAHWEYRGPATDPSNDVGTASTCDSGGSDSEPPQSPTVDNGFVIFDSALWDGPTPPCGTPLGNGEAPGPHFAPLTSPSLNFEDYTDIIVSFSHLYKQWTGNSNVYVEISVDGGEWEPIWEADIDVGNSTPSGEIINLNLSDLAGGSSDVRLRWVFDGQYYWWMIDDITFCEIPPYDLRVGAVQYGDFDVLETENFSGLEYKKIPDEIDYVLDPAVRVYNDGSTLQNTVDVTIALTALSTLEEVYSQNTVINAISGQNSSLSSTNSVNLPTDWGQYGLTAQVSNEDEEPTPENNVSARSLWMTDVEFVRDTLAMDGAYLPTDELFSDPYEVGNIYHWTGNAIEAHNVGVGLAVGSGGIGQPLQARIYSFSLIDGVGFNLIAETETINITADDLNGFGEEKMVYLEFDEPVTLQPQADSAYAVMAYSAGGAEHFLFATSGDSPDYGSWVKFNEASWFYLNATPMVRLNLGEVVNVDEAEPLTLEEAPAPYPNPASGWVSIPGLDPKQGFQWTWIDARGRIAGQGTASAAEHNGEFDLATPKKTGVYTLRIQPESGAAMQHAIVVR